MKNFIIEFDNIQKELNFQNKKITIEEFLQFFDDNNDFYICTHEDEDVKEDFVENLNELIKYTSSNKEKTILKSIKKDIESFDVIEGPYFAWLEINDKAIEFLYDCFIQENIFKERITLNE